MLGRGGVARALLGAVVVLGLLLVVPVVRTDLAAPAVTPLWVFTDALVGVAFVSAGAFAVGPMLERALVAAVGTAWLFGSLAAFALTLHQGVLILAFVAFPSGRPRGWVRLWLCALALAVAAQLFTPSGTAGVLVFAAVCCAVLDRPRGAAWYPSASAAAVATGLLLSSGPLQGGPGAGPVVYAAALVVVAGAFPVATRQLARAWDRLDEAAVTGRRQGGLAGLEPVLAGLLDDRALLLRPIPAGAPGRHADPTRGRRWPAGLIVDVGEGESVAVESASPTLADPATRRRVGRVVQLVVAQERLQALEDERVAELAAARVRLLESADRERARMAQALRSEAIEPLQRVTTLLAPLRSGDDEEVLSLIDQLRDSTESATAQMLNIVAGVPPVELGHGRLRAALAEMGSRLGSRVVISVGADVVASELVESTAYYVCAEAVANALKHSGSPTVTASVSRDGPALRVDVVDAGVGSAHAEGSGLQGLADRVAAVGGRFGLGSPPSGGTHVVAELPV